MAIARPRYNNKRKRRIKKTGSKFHQGVYVPIHEMTDQGLRYKKYQPPRDTLMNSNSEGMTYRSSWEKVFAQWLDHNDDVLMWSSEPFPIPYISPKDNQVHRYYIDFIFTTRSEKFLIEIKPKSQTTDKHLINQAKWDSARQYCKKIGATFLIITEKELKHLGLLK